MNFDQKDSWRKLFHFLEESRRDLQLDAVFFTGDVANKGKTAEYKTALEFLNGLTRATGVERGRIFIVPGNHDVDADAIRNSHLINLATRSSAASAALLRLDEFFEDPTILELFDEKFPAFREKLGQPLVSWKGGREPALLRVIACGEGDDVFRVGVVGLNSARQCNPKDRGGDKGRLVVGRTILSDALDRLTSSCPDVVFVLLHHPLDWLQPEDRQAIEQELVKRAHFVLFGHLHTSEFSRITTRRAPKGGASSGALFMRAGAVYETDPEVYQQKLTIGRWDPAHGKVEIRAFCRADAHADWEVEPEAFLPPEPRGRKTFPAIRVRTESRLALGHGALRLVTTPPAGGSNNTAGQVSWAYVECDESILDDVLEVRYRRVCPEPQRIMIGRDPESAFAQPFIVSRGMTIEATAVFKKDRSERSLGTFEVESAPR